KRRTVRGSVPHPFGLVSLYLLDFRTVLGYFYQPLQPPFGVTDVPKHKTKQLAFVQPTLGPSAERYKRKIRSRGTLMIDIYLLSKAWDRTIKHRSMADTVIRRPK